jgi:hypothetical protein
MFLTPSKQIASRFFVASLLRMTLRQVPRATGGKPTTPTFEGEREGHEEEIEVEIFIPHVFFVLL